jgi:hypothetical protein
MPPAGPPPGPVGGKGRKDPGAPAVVEVSKRVITSLIKHASFHTYTTTLHFSYFRVNKGLCPIFSKLLIELTHCHLVFPSKSTINIHKPQLIINIPRVVSLSYRGRVVGEINITVITVVLRHGLQHKEGQQKEAQPRANL